MHTRTFFASVGLVAALVLTACGGSSGGGNAGASAAPLAVAADATGQLAFQQKTLSAAANQAFTVQFSNPAPLQHNWVLVQPGQEQAVADAAGAKGGDPTGVAGVIAGGAVLNSNGNEPINVPATPAGTYTYICTVPGHYAAGMAGKLTIQ